MEITGWRRIVREWEKIYLWGVKLKSHMQRELVDKTTRNVRRWESGKRLWARTWSPCVCLCAVLNERGVRQGAGKSVGWAGDWHSLLNGFWTEQQLAWRRSWDTCKSIACSWRGCRGVVCSGLPCSCLTPCTQKKCVRAAAAGDR